MNHINSLRDFGKSRECLIIGGGESLNDFDFGMLTDTYIISLNNHLNQLADMILYYDRNMIDYFNSHDIADKTILIGFKHKESIDYTVERCDYYYNYDDMVFGDSGFHALQFADKIFNFKKIYLIGYDYTTNGKSYHHDEPVSDPDKLHKFTTWSIGKVLSRYNDIKWSNNIYNCNKGSSLKIFKYGLPY